MKKFILAKKDHNHFNNTCCVCLQECDDSALVALWINRVSGYYPKEYLEPDYACTMCLVKTPIEQIEINNKI